MVKVRLRLFDETGERNLLIAMIDHARRRAGGVQLIIKYSNSIHS